MKAKQVSLIFPLFNEEKRLPKSLIKIQDFLKKNQDYEIIFISDGSTDKTVQIIKQFIVRKPNCYLSHYELNQGKGAALKKGILQATGKYIIFSDIDLSTPLALLTELLKQLKNADIAIGIRRHPESQVLKHQSFIREFLGQCFTILTKMLVGWDIYDATCGFKGFKRVAGKKIFSKMKVNRWAYDAEILYLAKKYKYKIAQVPVIWKNDTGTKVNMLRDGVSAFIDLIRIKIWDLMGEYN
jgi:dolichyl-phosphate beta-glucosyltransferase